MAEDRMLNDEILLGLIKANSGGGGGGTTNYNLLENKPQIAGTELQGNKSLADLGIASANDLAGKQDALTAGIYIQMDNGVISVKRDITQTAQTLYYHITIKSNDNYINVEKTQNGVKVSDTEYNWQAVTSNPANVDNCFTISTSGTNWVFTNLIASTTQPAGYAKTLYKSDPRYDYSTTYVTTVDADKKLIIQSELDDAMATKQDTLTFDDTPTDGSNNPVKSNGIYDALATKANTDMVAADFNAGTSYTAGNYCVQDGKLYKFKNNHSGAWSSADVDEVKITGELSALRSGLTNLLQSDTFTGTADASGNVSIGNAINVLAVYGSHLFVPFQYLNTTYVKCLDISTGGQIAQGTEVSGTYYFI